MKTISPVKVPETAVPTGAKKICLTETAAGANELGHSFKKALESELQDVMIKIWQELPDDSPSDVDKHVIDKFRGELGDEFGNLLGLNVRKRILGLCNTLFVKVKFDSFISAACLAGFLKQYNVQKAKKVDGQKYVFVAKMKDYEDFDALCNTQDLIYDQVKFNVEPCYKFMTCPEILATDKITSESNNEKKADSNNPKTEKPRESSKSERTKESKSDKTKYSTRSRDLDRPTRIMNRYKIKDGMEIDRRKYREEKFDGKSKSSAHSEVKTKSSTEVKTENSNSKDSAVKTDDSEKSDPKAQNAENKDDISKSHDSKVSNDVEISDGLDLEDMAMLLADSIVLDECSGSDDESK